MAKVLNFSSLIGLVNSTVWICVAFLGCVVFRGFSGRHRWIWTNGGVLGSWDCKSWCMMLHKSCHVRLPDYCCRFESVCKMYVLRWARCISDRVNIIGSTNLVRSFWWSRVELCSDLSIWWRCDSADRVTIAPIPLLYCRNFITWWARDDVLPISWKCDTSDLSQREYTY